MLYGKLFKKIILIQGVIIFLLIIALIFSCSTKNEKIVVKESLFNKSEIIENKTTSNTKSLLIIGNSISLHEKCDYWWSEWGMAATKKENDFVHKLATKIAQNNNLYFKVLNFASWEVNSHDRSEILYSLDNFLESKYDYVVVQLGENVNDVSTLNSDFLELISHIKKYNKHSKIIVVGNFWENSSVDEIKKDICKKTKSSFIDLKEIQTNEYKAGLGTTIFGDKNEKHKISHGGVANHPNDKAMMYISNKIYEYLKD